MDYNTYLTRLPNMTSMYSDDGHFAQSIVSNARDKVRNMINPKGGRIPEDVQIAQDFAIQQMEHFVSFRYSDVNWESVCKPLCKIKTGEELQHAVQFLDQVLELFRKDDKALAPTITAEIQDDPVLTKFYAEMNTDDENDCAFYDKLRTEKKSLTKQREILNRKIALLGILKRKHHPLRKAVKPVLKLICELENQKKETETDECLPKAKKQKTYFHNMLGDVFGVMDETLW
jgi:hypothetical protein